VRWKATEVLDPLRLPSRHDQMASSDQKLMTSKKSQAEMAEMEGAALLKVADR